MKQNTSISTAAAAESIENSPVFHEAPLIDKKYVHKSNPENVHIYHFRRAIPRSISARTFEKDIADKVSPDEHAFLKKYYSKAGPGDTHSGPAYLLKSLPLKMKIEELESILSAADQENKEFALRHYRKNKGEATYALAGPINDIEELRLANIINARAEIIADSEKTQISAILDKIESLEREEVFYANMYIDPEHQYFFEHKLDHVPGMMLVETSRQIFYSCYHIYGKTPMTGIEFILSNMNIQFMEYIWMSYPTRIMLTLHEKTTTDEGYWQKCSCAISYYQKHKEKAVIKLETSNMKRPALYKVVGKKALKNALSGDEKATAFQSVIYLEDTCSNTGFFGSILDVSQKHILAKFRSPATFDREITYNFNMDLEKSLYSHGKCLMEWQQVDNDMCVARFQLSDVNRENMDNIVKTINRLRTIREEHKII